MGNRISPRCHRLEFGMRIVVRLNKKLCAFLILILTFTGLVLLRIQLGQRNLLQQLHQHTSNERNPFDGNNHLRDWHNYEAIARDERRHHREGLGEYGIAASLRGDIDTTKAVAASLRKYGFNTLLSAQISPKRSLPDVRDKKCQTIKYFANLPKASIIIVQYNEHRSILIRTLSSIINRTPSELLHEILLVNDYSNPKILGNDFEKLIKLKFKKIVKIIEAPKRLGLIKARILGARSAQSDILVFLDAHIEVTHNWLPPLLSPIVEDAQTCTTPMADTIDYMTFAYIPTNPSRGGFNWEFNYVQLPLSSAERDQLPAPHNNPVMNGGLFAIAKNFFWHLGGYDEGLEIWGAEQFELSFKIWMCGGRLLEVPCSRVGHLFRSPMFVVRYTHRTDDFIAKNYKRVAEVWLDEYKEVLYEHIPKLNEIQSGNIDELKKIRQNLKCKNFKWFLTTIAPDLLRAYPTVEPTDYASGALQSLAAPELCLDTLESQTRNIIEALRPCSPDLRHPYATQRWHLSFRRDLRHTNDDCLEVQTWTQNAPVWLWPCHNQAGNQFWYYDRQSQLLVHGNGANGIERRCLEANLVERRVYVNDCDFVKPTMKWHFGFVNQTAMNGFYKNLD